MPDWSGNLITRDETDACKCLLKSCLRQRWHTRGKMVCFERSYCWHFSWNYECFLRTLVITINHSYCYYGNECISIKNKGNVHGNWRSICRTAVGLYHSSACNKAKGQRVIKQAPTCSTASRAEFHLPHSTWPQNKIKKNFKNKKPASFVEFFH